MYKRTIYSLDLDINEVVYLRREGKIIAAKYLGLVSKTSGYGNITKHIFYRADGKEEIINVSCGYTKEKNKAVYRNIEDAIHGINSFEYRLVDITNILKEAFGFCHRRTDFGANCLGKVVWKWDGYGAKDVHIGHFSHDIYWDGKWKCVYIGNIKYYTTREECMQENHTDVVTF